MSLEQILKSTRPLVPEVPDKITGPCVYGYLITDEHINHFRALNPKIQISDPASLVSCASAIISKIHIASTLPVNDHQGEEAVCLALIDCHDRDDPIIMQWPDEFITDIEIELGIEGKPDWYPSRYQFPPFGFTTYSPP